MNGALLPIAVLGSLAVAAETRGGPVRDGAGGSASRVRRLGGVLLVTAAATAVALYSPKARAAVAMPRRASTPEGERSPTEAPAAPTQGRLSSDIKRRIINRVSKHEGKAYSTNPNTDGAGLSYGVIQWTQKSGNLYELLASLQKRDPSAFARFFGPNWKGLLDLTARGESGISASISDGTASGPIWREPWLARFNAAGQYPPFEAAQWEFAENGSHMRGAEEIANLLGVHTERALVLFYDRTVQQGPTKPVRVAQRLVESWGGQRPPYMQILRDFAKRNADLFRGPSPRGEDWRRVDNEYHDFAGKVDLYRSISRRSESVLSDPNLSDESLLPRAVA